MPLMKLACTALERVPLTRPKIIEHLVQKFNQDLVFCRAPDDNVLTSGVYGMSSNPMSPNFTRCIEHEIYLNFHSLVRQTADQQNMIYRLSGLLGFLIWIWLV